MGIICMIKEAWWTMWYGFAFSGHDYVEQDDGTLRCKVCGKVST